MKKILFITLLTSSIVFVNVKPVDGKQEKKEDSKQTRVKVSSKETKNTKKADEGSRGGGHIDRHQKPDTSKRHLMLK